MTKGDLLMGMFVGVVGGESDRVSGTLALARMSLLSEWIGVN